MRSTRIPRARTMAVATLATGLLAGGIITGAVGAFTAAQPADTTTDTVVSAAAERSQKQFSGTFQQSDGCPYLVTSGGTRYYLPGYTIGGNGALYKKGGGFIAYPDWRIQATGTKYHKTGGTTTCATWGTGHRIKTKSIYATTTEQPQRNVSEGCKTETSKWKVRNHVVNIKTADIKVRITRCVDSSGALTSQTTSRMYATTTSAGDLLYKVTVTPETTPAVIKASGSQYVLQQDVEHKTCLGTRAGTLCGHNNITFTSTVNKKGTKGEVDAKDESADDDIVPA